MSKLHLSVFPAIVALIFLSPPASGQEWAAKMFRDMRHDFGTVARGAKTEYEFQFTNLYRDDVHVASVRSSCGCTTPFVKDGRDTLKSRETGAIVAHVNSDRFLGSRGATITVTFDRPQYAEVALPVTVFIRDDLVLQPGSVQFGTISKGAGGERQIDITSPGRGDLVIRSVRNNDPFLNVGFAETGRWNNLTRYRLDVRLDPNAPVGHLSDYLVLETNLGDNAQVPVPVEGLVEPALAVTPEWLFFGVVQPGQRVVRQVVIRSSSPTAIRRITPEGSPFEVNLDGLKTPKTMHIVSIAFTGRTPGEKVRQTLKIETDRPDRTAEFAAEAVTGAAPAASTGKSD